MTKLKLRQRFIAQQKSLSQNERHQKSEKIIQNLFDNFNFSDKRFVNCFITLEKNNEINSSQIFEGLWRKFSNVTTTAPRVNFETNLLEHVRVSPDTRLIENKWQILEPEGNEIVAAEKLDAVFVPLLAFDKLGFRIGYGKGFYDKFLKKCRADCQKIGLSLFPPVEKIDDVEDFDVGLDFCVTTEEFWQFKIK